MNELDFLGTALGLLYLILEIRENHWMWVVGSIMPLIYIFVLFDKGLYADCGMEVYYFLAGIYGLFYWLRHRTGQGATQRPLPISVTPTGRAIHHGMMPGNHVGANPARIYVTKETHRPLHHRPLDALPQVYRAMVGMVHCRRHLRRPLPLQRHLRPRPPLHHLHPHGLFRLPPVAAPHAPARIQR